MLISPFLLMSFFLEFVKTGSKFLKKSNFQLQIKIKLRRPVLCPNLSLSVASLLWARTLMYMSCPRLFSNRHLSSSLIGQSSPVFPRDRFLICAITTMVYGYLLVISHLRRFLYFRGQHGILRHC